MMKTSSCQDRLGTNTPQGMIETLKEVVFCPQARTGEGVNTIAVRLGLQEHDSFFEFSLCLSRAWLGKMIILM